MDFPVIVLATSLRQCEAMDDRWLLRRQGLKKPAFLQPVFRDISVLSSLPPNGVHRVQLMDIGYIETMSATRQECATFPLFQEANLMHSRLRAPSDQSPIRFDRWKCGFHACPSPPRHRQRTQKARHISFSGLDLYYSPTLNLS